MHIYPNFYSASNLELDFSKNSLLVLLNLLLKKGREICNSSQQPPL